MAKYYRVKVKDDWRWGGARVSGRNFAKSGHVEVSETEMMQEILDSPLLVVEEVEPEVEPEVEAVVEVEAEAEPKPRRRRRVADDESVS